MGAHRAETKLARRLVKAATSLHQQPSIEQTMRTIVYTAPEIVDGAEHAGLTALRRDRTMESPAYTDEVVLLLDRVQSEENEGPCLAAAEQDAVVRIDDMATETRWPKFAARALDLGVRSLIACGLGRTDGWRVALNLHAQRPGAFSGLDGEIASLYAAHAALALGNATTVEAMRGGLDRRQVIGEATGILMERHRSNSPEAFTRLVQASQRLNTKIGDVARYVILTGQDPEEINAADLVRAP
ncbi:GAF and ANTAR domain-containing protein [Actinocrinis sp.]|uniref:GAF and ANTAR domain-containing protein n=1 Tax=Actinocrinis sp. TaxID=1920516 RepID=UPI002D6FE9AA|nr:GAF and ANTAR domain-containing protein [Actinocrinis sp.]HZP51359.1 GAF and ANTAR domain-containing protein [Actinocrinis sp.]